MQTLRFTLAWPARWIQTLLQLLLLCTLLVSVTKAHSATKTLLVLGDSLSAEYGLARGSGWVGLLEQRLKAQGFDARVINAGISGDTTSAGRARLPALLSKHQPAIVILELGGNDGLRGLPIAAMEANLRAMINASKITDAKVLLLGMQIPSNYGREYTQAFAGAYPKLAKETGASLVPFFLEGLATRPDLFQPDRIHPAAAAHPIMLDNVWPHLKTLMRQ